MGEMENETEYIWWIDEGQDYARLWWEVLDIQAIDDVPGPGGIAVAALFSSE